jgi:hypothetical protein
MVNVSKIITSPVSTEGGGENARREGAEHIEELWYLSHQA